MRIEITGPIGSGKTTLARLLARHFGWQIAIETPEDVPYWAQTYGGRGGFELEKDLSFLIVHSGMVREAATQPGAPLVCDFSFLLDLAYARLGLTEPDYAVYEAINRRMQARCGAPSLIINLRCTPPTLLRRIAARGRNPERGISPDFLQRLGDSLDALLATDAAAPVVDLDSETLDFTVEGARTIAGLRPHLGAWL